MQMLNKEAAIIKSKCFPCKIFTIFMELFLSNERGLLLKACNNLAKIGKFSFYLVRSNFAATVFRLIKSRKWLFKSAGLNIK